MRRFGKGDAGQLADMGWRLTGSADLYGDDGRSAYNSINFVTCHDGFTLHDLVSYNGKHNEANGENNQDGANDNHSWNCGVEGDTDDPGVLALRKQLMKNHACYLLFASGTPMILGGDEFARIAARQQQRLLPGQRDQLVRLGRRVAPATISSSSSGRRSRSRGAFRSCSAGSSTSATISTPTACRT